MVAKAPEGETLSQFAPLCTEALAVKLVALPAVIERVCDDGAALFKVPKKFSEVGANVSVPPAAGLTTRVTAAVWVTPPETTETVPP